MDRLDRLESESIYILREAYRDFRNRNLSMLWSIGKDSTVLLYLSRKAFFGHVPFPLVHIDTRFKIPEMIAFRDRIAREWRLDMIYGENADAIRERRTFPDGAVDRLACCRGLKSEALKKTLSGEWPRYRMSHATGSYESDPRTEPFQGVIVGIRADEEGSRSKERIFSPRSSDNEWNIGDQPPELWHYYNTDFPAGCHVRIHPLMDWTELDIWEYIRRENIPFIPLYLNQGEGKRYRSLGCFPCTQPIDSLASSVEEIIAELKSGKLSKIAERSGRAQDREDGGSLETLRREGYM